MKVFFKFKKIIIFIAIISCACFFLFFENDNINIAKAGSGDNVGGYAWSGNYGWISFNCVNDGTCGAFDYGVNIDSVLRNFSGYAWSSNLGWIQFGGNDIPPDNYAFNSNCENVCDNSNLCTACYNVIDGKVYGWAKILSLGDDGWIRLDDDNVGDGFNYGVLIDRCSGEFSGLAWNGSDNDLGSGWVSFNCSTEGACASSDYKVSSEEINWPPQANNLTAPNWNYNNACDNWTKQAFLNWEFYDICVDSQSAYRIILDDDNNPAGPILDTGKVISGASQYSVGPEYLDYNESYYWWVKIWDSEDQESEWKQYNSVADTDNNDGNPLTFTTYRHNFPDVYFSWFPENPSEDKEISFFEQNLPNKSQVYSDANPNLAQTCESLCCVGGICAEPCGFCQYQWSAEPSGKVTITNGISSSSIMVFDELGDYDVTLKVEDEDGYYCELTEANLFITFPLPVWEEVKP